MAQYKAQGLSDKIMHNNIKFWKIIQSLTVSPKWNIIAQRMGDAVEEEAISNFWADCFGSILNCIDDWESKNKMNDSLTVKINIEDRFSPVYVKNAIKQPSDNQ